MDNQKFQNLLQDEKFIEVVGGEDTVAGVEEKLNKEGLAVTKTDVEALINKGIKSVDDGTLDAISGGGPMWEGFKAGITLHGADAWKAKADAKKAIEGADEGAKDQAKKDNADAISKGTGATLGTIALLGGVAAIGTTAGVFIPKLIEKLKNK